MKLFNKIVRPLCFCKARKIADHCGRFVAGKVLDVGAGRCYIAKEIKTRFNLDVACVDVDNLNETDLKLDIYDGKRLPYKSGKFDTVLLVYVLHHCENPVEVLKECARVAKKGGKVIVFEDFGFILATYALDWISNKLHNVKAPLNFKSELEWKDVFRSVGLELVHTDHGVERQFFYPFTEHKMFVLKVRK